MNYLEALDYIASTGRFGVKLGLTRVEALLEEAGRPQAGLRGILVAGTNGKGSTCAVAESVLRAAGRRTGMMPKPHLQSYTERIQAGGVPISEESFAAAVSGIRPAVERVGARLGPPTEFEILTALAVQYLAPRCDRLVAEVGMGGRLDATNVLDLGVAVITNVDLDHQRWLGTTVEAIAAEKAAIIKPGNAAVTGCEAPALEVVEAAAAGAGVQLQRLGGEIGLRSTSLDWDGHRMDTWGPGYEHRDLILPLVGSFQPANAALAIAAVHALEGETGSAVAAGVASVRWPGRLETVALEPRVVLDGGHNPAGLSLVVADLARLVSAGPVTLLFAAMEDKDLDTMLSILARLPEVKAIFTRAASAGARAADPQSLAEIWERSGAGVAAVEPDLARALPRAQETAGPAGTVLVCGSLYLVGEVRKGLVA